MNFNFQGKLSTKIKRLYGVIKAAGIRKQDKNLNMYK